MLGGRGVEAKFCVLIVEKKMRKSKLRRKLGNECSRGYFIESASYLLNPSVPTKCKITNVKNKWAWSSIERACTSLAVHRAGGCGTSRLRIRRLRDP